MQIFVSICKKTLTFDFAKVTISNRGILFINNWDKTYKCISVVKKKR